MFLILNHYSLTNLSLESKCSEEKIECDQHNSNNKNNLKYLDRFVVSESILTDNWKRLTLHTRTQTHIHSKVEILKFLWAVKNEDQRGEKSESLILIDSILNSDEKVK